MKKQSNISIGLLIFIAVFGITNIPNNYAAIGAEALSWFVLLPLYFIPIALIMAEMASYDATTSSGISRWVEIGTTKKIAFLCGWAYFIENVFYLPTIASRIPVFLSWVFAPIDSLDTVVDQSGNIKGIINATDSQGLFLLLAFVTMIIGVVISINFEKIFEKIGKYIGGLSLVIAFIFILFTVLSVIVLPHQAAYPLTVDNVRPTFAPETISTLVWIIFAIGGVETIGSVVNKVDNPQKRIPKVITIGSILVIIAYAVGVLGISFIMTPDQLSTDALENAIPVVFAQLGLTYGLHGFWGVVFLKFIMLGQVFITISAIVLWLVTTINVLFIDSEKGIFPKIIEKKDKQGRPVNAMIFTVVLVLLFLLIISSATFSNIYYVLYDMSTISVVIPFVLLLISYINFKRKNEAGTYVFIKDKKWAMVVGTILLVITSFAFIFGVVDPTYLANGQIQEALSWFIISFGGMAIFMVIGYALYLRKTQIILSDVILIALFLISIIIFNLIILLLVVIFFIIILIVDIKNQKKVN